VTDVLMPALSPTMEEGTLAKWLVKVGDTVKSGDVIAEIETDKATMEVEAVDEGVIEALLVPEGTEAVKVNFPIARLAGEGSPQPAAPHPPSGHPCPLLHHPPRTPIFPPKPPSPRSPCATPCATPWPRRCGAIPTSS
jgi:pyruvate/2-oxoglutarate dehydrogenase complex dihydrolipoamide acyltransferase (E2) component